MTAVGGARVRYTVRRMKRVVLAAVVAALVAFVPILTKVPETPPHPVIEQPESNERDHGEHGETRGGPERLARESPTATAKRPASFGGDNLYFDRLLDELSSTGNGSVLTRPYAQRPEAPVTPVKTARWVIALSLLAVLAVFELRARLRPLGATHLRLWGSLPAIPLRRQRQ